MIRHIEIHMAKKMIKCLCWRVIGSHVNASVITNNNNVDKKPLPGQLINYWTDTRCLLQHENNIYNVILFKLFLDGNRKF